MQSKRVFIWLTPIIPLVQAVMGVGFLGCKSAVLPFQVEQTAVAKLDSVAERMLLYQRDNGGWPQPGGNAINYNLVLTDAVKKALQSGKSKLDATIDDKATTREINYLVDAFSKTQNDVYKKAAERGVTYLLMAQNAKGGWGQFYPDSSSYRKHITYNDNAMIDVMWVMKRMAEGTDSFALLDKSLAPKAQIAVVKGIECILNTQFTQQGKLTAWCAQHDRNTLLPANARAFELASLSGSETVGILEFLMKIDSPSARVKQAIRSAVTWLDSVKLVGTTTKTIADATQPSGKDVIVVQSPDAVIWSRFYELETNKPFFCGRDGVKKYSLDQIENERRVGYGWYGTWPAKLITNQYPAWQARWDK
jgi:PelA/Pel-15E family pectate lyase